jgi:hypothetical protein
VNLEEILKIDMEALKQQYAPKIKQQEPPSNKSHRLSFGIIPRNLKTEVIDYLERVYNTNGKFPGVRSLDTHIKSLGYRPPDDWQVYLSDAELEEVLLNRGLPTYDSPPNRIDSNFALATTLICDISDKRTKAAKLKDAGLTTRQWTGFLKRRSHYNYFQERLNRVWNDEVEPNAKLAISRAVESGDLQAVKYFHEYTDRYRPQDQQIVNLSLIISGLLEILAKHLNKELLQTVATELEATGLLNVTSASSRELPVGETNVR